MIRLKPLMSLPVIRVFAVRGSFSSRPAAIRRSTPRPNRIRRLRFTSPCTLYDNAEGRGDLSFAWHHNGTVHESAAASELILESVSLADTGSYYGVVSNAWGQAREVKKNCRTCLKCSTGPHDTVTVALPLPHYREPIDMRSAVRRHPQGVASCRKG